MDEIDEEAMHAAVLEAWYADSQHGVRWDELDLDDQEFFAKPIREAVKTYLRLAHD